MRVVAALIVLGCLIATTAIAQDSPPATPTVRWERQPDGRAFARNFPRRAVDANVSGAAVLCCTVNPDRTLSCTAPFEWPAGYGFGEATLRISREFRVSEQAYLEARETPNNPFRRMIRWVISPGSRQLDEAYTQINEATQSICDGPAAPAS